MDSDLFGLDLVLVRALRVLDSPLPAALADRLLPSAQSLDVAIDRMIETRGRIQFSYERRRNGKEELPTADEFRDGYIFEIRHLRAPLTLATTPRDEMPSNQPSAPRSDDVRALDFLVAHRALATNGFEFRISYSDSTWHRVERLHQELLSISDTARSGQVCTPLDRQITSIGTALLEQGGEALSDTLRYVSTKVPTPIYTFSDLPLEWMAVPKLTDPLCYVRPVVRRPVYPLTAALQAELMQRDIIDLTGGLNVLILECVWESDPLFRHTKKFADAVEQRVGVQLGVPIQRRRPRTHAEFLRDVTSSPDANVVLILAHGIVHPTERATGLCVGHEDVVGPGELPFLPPVVILSACNTSVRGHGWRNIADSCLPRGAASVISAAVPVNVRRNSHLVIRFLRELQGAIKGWCPHDTLLDVWHHVQSTHVVYDILDGWKKVQSRYGEAERLFKHGYAGRLRRGHVIRDTIALLTEVTEGLKINGLRRHIESRVALLQHCRMAGHNLDEQPHAPAWGPTGISVVAHHESKASVWAIRPYMPYHGPTSVRLGLTKSTREGGGPRGAHPSWPRRACATVIGSPTREAD